VARALNDGPADVNATRMKGRRSIVLLELLVAMGCQEDPLAADDPGSEGATEVDGADEDSGEEASTGAAPLPGQPVCVDYGEPCTECEMQACPELFCECYGNPDCGLLAQCVLACPAGDATCQAACATTFPAGTSTSALLADCAAVDCSDECAALGTIPPPLTACERCVYDECGPQMDACFAVGGCPELLVCINACVGDAICQSGCAALYPAALAAATTVGNCSVAHCSEPCL
jgi:hypothetical protein